MVLPENIADSNSPSSKCIGEKDEQKMDHKWLFNRPKCSNEFTGLVCSGRPIDPNVRSASTFWLKTKFVQMACSVMTQNKMCRR